MELSQNFFLQIDVRTREKNFIAHKDQLIKIIINYVWISNFYPFILKVLAAERS